MQKSELANPELDLLWDRIEGSRRGHNIGTKSWSCAYHVAFGLAIVIGLIVATISGKESITFFGFSNSALVSFLSLIAAILTGVGAFAGFEGKWRANRTTREDLYDLLLQCEDPRADPVKVRERLREIHKHHEDMMRGAGQRSTTGQQPPSQTVSREAPPQPAPSQ